jgi:hypothetical protein
MKRTAATSPFLTRVGLATLAVLGDFAVLAIHKAR